jgi:hypothetical protein
VDNDPVLDVRLTVSSREPARRAASRLRSGSYIEGLQFDYALYPLPPGRLPFRRWRWELWHGANLVAAGWRLARPEAGRALRVHAAEFGHGLFGLPVPARDPRAGRGDLYPGTAERLAIGAISYTLVPRALDRRA